MTTRLEKIKAMSAYEMAEKINFMSEDLSCDYCYYADKGYSCADFECIHGVEKWLNEEVEE